LVDQAATKLTTNYYTWESRRNIYCSMKNLSRVALVWIPKSCITKNIC